MTAPRIQIRRFLSRLITLVALAAPVPALAQLTDAQIRIAEIREVQAKRAADVAAWKRDRAALIKGYTDRGATEAEAAAAVDDLIAHGEQQVSDGATVLSTTTPKTAALDQKLTILIGLSNLDNERFQVFAGSLGLVPPSSFFGCLCGSYSIMGAGISYNPLPAGDCQNTMPCKGGNWGCVSYDLPANPRAWASCANAHKIGDTSMADLLAEKVRGMQERYDRDVCDRLRSVLTATKDLLAQGKLQPKDQSFLATHDLEQSFADFITGMNITGVTEVAAGALSDKVPIAIKNWTGVDITGPDAPTGLGFFLTVDETPSDTGLNNPYVRVTKALSIREDIAPGAGYVPMSYEMKLARRIMRSAGSLSPGDVFRMATEVTNGDVPLAALVTHNLLKEAAYAKREGKLMIIGKSPFSLQGGKDQATKDYLNQIKDAYTNAFDKNATFAGDDFIMQPNLIGDKLQDIRPVYDPQISDRLGPWYHSFGLVFIGTNPTLGETAAYAGALTENVTRMLNLGSGRSLGKEAANRCSAVLVSLMNRNMAAAAAK